MFNTTIAGNIGQDAETRQAGQSNVTNFSVAGEQRGKDGKKTQWVRCAIWGKRGDSLRSYLTKGTKVAVAGELTVGEYNGKPQVDLNASDVTLLGGGNSNGGSGDQSGGSGGGYDAPPQGGDMDDEIPW